MVIDFETRSAADIRKVGAWRYCMDARADALCAAVIDDSGKEYTWIGPAIRHVGLSPAGPQIDDRGLASLIETSKEIVAHNAEFEFAVWSCMMLRYGFNPLPMEKLKCSAAKAAFFGLPRGLAAAANVLHLTEQKDSAGKGLIKSCCTPQTDGSWNESPIDLGMLVDYCIQDIRTEKALWDELPDMPANEVEIWRLSTIINARGVDIDRDTMQAWADGLAEAEAGLGDEIHKLTGGYVNAATQTQKLLALLRSRGVKLPDLSSASVTEAIGRDDVDDITKKILRIRQKASMSSTAKIRKMQLRTCSDGRLRGELVYYGASRSGRWSGHGVQLQNLPRGNASILPEDANAIIKKHGASSVALEYGSVHEACSSCIRSLIVPGAGNRFACADFSSIEGRVLAWVSGDEATLDAYRQGSDLYKKAASVIFGVPASEVTKDQRQTGKVAELACGYQGSVGALQNMAKMFSLRIEDDEAKRIVTRWREARPATVKFWDDVEKVFIRTMKADFGTREDLGRLRFARDRNSVMIFLPSRRPLYYHFPKIETVSARWDPSTHIQEIAYKGVYMGRMTKKNTYGGSLVENIVQGIARDVLANAMSNAEKAGYTVVLTVHDEILAEVPASSTLYSEGLCRAISKPPAWLDGCPLSADGWDGYCYRK